MKRCVTSFTLCASLLFGLNALGAGSTNWWAFQPLSSEVPPATSVPEEWSLNPIDRFVYRALKSSDLEPSPTADRRDLIRRAIYDLTGLPPSLEETESFVNDDAPNAYEQLIDRLLASPHYGEQWGRHWLDVIRFGESRGFERNEIIRNIWPFRDYVIRSFNEDKPFDRFIVEQLAGDVVAKDDPDIEVATAFLVAGPYDDVGNQDPKQARLIRANTIDEIINATSGAFLALTVSCARCHDHKFDPISQEDYHRFYSIFSGVHHGERTLATSVERAAREIALKPLQERQATAQKELNEFEESVVARATDSPGDTSLPPVHPHGTEDIFKPVTAQFVRLNIKSNNRNPRAAGNVRIDELEIWSTESTPSNVALASKGATVEGPARRAEDFAEAYSVKHVNDGAYGARWISPGAGALTVRLSNAVEIDRVRFSADGMKLLPPTSGEITFVGEYTVEVSEDGENWTEVANSLNRQPVDVAFERERKLQAALTDEDRTRIRELRQTLNEINREIAAIPALQRVWAGRFEQPREPARIFKGGDPERAGKAVAPGSLSTLDAVAASFELDQEAPEATRRLNFARWLIQSDNPLTARVLANRVWQYHFGRGLVDSPSDFGELGGQPSHPELLDWLARRLREHGWRLKPLHREIMLSQTYRQASRWNERAASIDADSRLLWRFPPRRLQAEELRDTILFVAGKLDTTAGGPGFKLYRYLQDNVATYLPLDTHGPETYRRAVYHHNARAMVADLMTQFDQPDCAFAAPKRARTTSPLQALTLMNHSFTLDMAEALAERALKGTDAESAQQQIESAFRLTLLRDPTAEERSDAEELVRHHGLSALCRALLNSNELLYLE